MKKLFVQGTCLDSIKFFNTKKLTFFTHSKFFILFLSSRLYFWHIYECWFKFILDLSKLIYLTLGPAIHSIHIF